jgi:hypothetical protein
MKREQLKIHGHIEERAVKIKMVLLRRDHSKMAISRSKED